jgi:hypothetical protein
MQFQRNPWAISLLVFLMICSFVTAEGKRLPLEQTDFSAEDDSVHRPVQILADIMAVLGKQEMVRHVLDYENLPVEKLPTSWFSASAIHLSGPKELDLVVVGKPPLAGANTVPFWVFLATSHGYQLVLMQSAHDLTVKNTRWKGYREIEASAESAVEFYSAMFGFDGNQYIKRSGKTKRLP